MSIVDADTTELPKHLAGLPGKVVRDVQLMAKATEVLLHGGSAMDIARVCHIHHARAVKLRDEIASKVAADLQCRYTPEALAAIKDELIETSLQAIGLADNDLRREYSARVHNAKTAAQKQLGQWTGFNAPTLNLTAEVHTHSPDQEMALWADEGYRNAYRELERAQRRALAFATPLDVTGGVRGESQRGEVEVPSPLGVDERPDDGGRLGTDSSSGDLHAAEARQVGIPVEVVPGVVSRHLPGSGGDLG